MKTSIVYNEDCVTGMKRFSDKQFDLAIVDPPYGIGADKGTNGFGTSKNRKYKGDWDNETPDIEYWNELFRISKNQIVWGGNYFELPVSKCWIVWDKIGNMKLENPFADCELAWTSFNKVVKKIVFRQQGFINDTNDTDRIHPTQKPTELYRKLLTDYAKGGDKIIDTHLGSGSSRIACYDMGFDFTGFEIDKDYFDAQEKRFKEFKAQLTLKF